MNTEENNISKIVVFILNIMAIFYLYKHYKYLKINLLL